ncbi:MAG TPA: glycosyltransferase family 39 protein [Candidatus Dormibacteraeota bacterium]|nr:glycosyltransferase family 39 protein [Candidatus Dormibacteraeota bacterium]
MTSETTAHVADDLGLTLPGAWPGLRPAPEERTIVPSPHPLGLSVAQEVVLGRAAVATLLLATGVLYLWDLGASGWANAYYSAAALAGSQSWLAFLFGSFDPGNAITVDKTPAALWVMSLSVRIFGLSAWSILVPQALMGVGAVGLLYATVSRVAGRLAGLVAGATLALTPVATLMFRFNNPDALLVLLLVAAAYALTRAIEAGSTRWIVLAGTLVGLGFLAKMLQAFLVIPAFTLVYLWAAPTPPLRRVVQVAAAGVAVIVSSGWFVALAVLWPAASRPFIGGSQTNSIIDLMLGYNGLGRISGNEVGRVGGGNPFTNGVGLLRLFQGEVGTEIAWLLPLATLAAVAIVVARRSAPRTDAIRAQALLWGGWLGVTGLVFSLMQGIFHEYYTVALAPAIGALVGIGVALAWRHRDRNEVRIASAAALVVSSGWAIHVLSLSPTWNPWLVPLLLGSATAAIALVLLAPLVRPALAPVALAAAVTVLLLVPGVASVATAAEPHSGALPVAAPRATVDVGRALIRLFGNGGFGGFGSNGTPPGGFGQGGSGPGAFGQGGFPGGPGQGGVGGLLDASAASPSLVAALKADAGRYMWTAATTGSNNAAGLALSSETSVMAIGGFNGSDPSPTLEQFKADVAAGRIHYYVATQDAAGFRGTQGGSSVARQIATWIEQTFAPERIGGVTVYDLSAR